MRALLPELAVASRTTSNKKKGPMKPCKKHDHLILLAITTLLILLEQMITSTGVASSAVTDAKLC